MGRAPCCEKVGLKKGRWTAEEDEILINYIRSNGEGSWRAMPKNAGLLRCGKSCRLRWINYLRSDLKRGNITTQEEDVIIKMHASLGNRWSLIASHLPGRTDNEIKNYWNSHLSRKIDTFRPRAPRPRPISFTQVTPPALMVIDDVSKMNSPPKAKGINRGSRWSMKKSKHPSSETYIKSYGVQKNNASVDEAAILLPQTPEVETESLPSLMIKNSMILDVESAEEISNDLMTSSGDHDQELEFEETLYLNYSEEGEGGGGGISPKHGLDLEEKCDNTILSPESEGREIMITGTVPGPYSETGKSLELDKGEALCFDDILVCNVQDLGDVLNETQDVVMDVGDEDGATCLKEMERDMEEAKQVSSTEEMSTDWFPSSPVSLAFGDDSIENSSWQCDDQSWDEQKCMLSWTSWLWEGENVESESREIQSLDPDRENAMVAWLLS